MILTLLPDAGGDVELNPPAVVDTYCIEPKVILVNDVVLNLA
jgi:hypothetical protein